MPTTFVTTSKKTKEKTTETTAITPSPPTTTTSTTESTPTTSSEISTGTFGNLPTNLTTTSSAPRRLQGRPYGGLIDAILLIVMFLYEK